MFPTVEGIFRNGKVELVETPENIEEARVIVTFLPGAATAPPGGPDFTADELVELESKLESWQTDWNAPGMEAYDDYEARRRGSGSVSAQ
jgi:hypothetical protein